jgi:hypothetical protein
MICDKKNMVCGKEAAGLNGLKSIGEIFTLSHEDAISQMLTGRKMGAPWRFACHVMPDTAAKKHPYGSGLETGLLR